MRNTHALAAVLMLALTACGRAPREAAAVCVSAQTGLRTADSTCDWRGGQGAPFYPYFYPAGYAVPPIGRAVSGGSPVRPASNVKIYQAPAAGGTQRVYTVTGAPKQPAPVNAPAKPGTVTVKPAAPPAPAKPFNPPPRKRR